MKRFAWIVALTFLNPIVAECVLLKSIAACFTARINSSGSLGTPPKNSLMMKGAGMKHVDSLNVNIAIGTVGIVFPPAHSVLFDCLQNDLQTVTDGVPTEADAA